MKARQLLDQVQNNQALALPFGDILKLPVLDWDKPGNVGVEHQRAELVHNAIKSTFHGNNFSVASRSVGKMPDLQTHPGSWQP